MKPIKVVILGTESVGKSTMVTLLSNYFNGIPVYEVGRDVVEKSDECTYEDLIRIKYLHAEAILNAEEIKNKKYIFIDTDINITKSYSHFLFKRDLPVESEIENTNKADIYLYLDKDVEYVDDGTRLNLKDRNDLDTCHKFILYYSNIKCYHIKGSYKERFEKCVSIVSSFKNN